jgi:hypothetical protein
MRAAIYLRVSTDGQTTANQERELRAVNVPFTRPRPPMRGCSMRPKPRSGRAGEQRRTDDREIDRRKGRRRVRPPDRGQPKGHVQRHARGRPSAAQRRADRQLLHQRCRNEVRITGVRLTKSGWRPSPPSSRRSRGAARYDNRQRTPGPTATHVFLEGKSPEVIARLAKINPLERLGQPEDIAAAVPSWWDRTAPGSTARCCGDRDAGLTRRVMGQECGFGDVISRCLVVFSAPRPRAWGGLVWVVIRVIRLFPRLVGFLLTGSHILVVDLAHFCSPESGATRNV